MPRLNRAADSLRALALVTQHHNSRVCKSDAECMQTVWRSSSLGLRETAVLLPRICQPPHRAVLSGTRNRVRPVALILHGDGLDGLEPLTSAFGSVLVTAGAALYRREKWLRYRP